MHDLPLLVGRNVKCSFGTPEYKTKRKIICMEVVEVALGYNLCSKVVRPEEVIVRKFEARGMIYRMAPSPVADVHRGSPSE